MSGYKLFLGIKSLSISVIKLLAGKIKKFEKFIKINKIG